MTDTYLGYDDIAVKNFYKISETSDLNWFYKDYQGVNGKELKDKDSIELSLRFKQIFLDRIDYLDDHKTREYYRKLTEVGNLEMKVYRIGNTLHTLKDIPLKNEYFQKFVEDLKQDGLKFGKPVKFKKDRIVYLKLMDSIVKGIRTKLAALKLEYKDILEPKEASKKFDLTREMIILQEVLPEQRINVNTDPLKLWDGYVKRAGEKAEDNKKQMAKIKK